MAAKPKPLEPRYGRLTPLGEAGACPRGKRLVWVLCDCNTKLKVRAAHLFAGRTRSCGCSLKGRAGRRPGFKLEEWIAAEQAKGRTCACGCGTPIKIRGLYHWKGIPDFVRGHHQRPKHAEVTARTREFLEVSEHAEPRCICGCNKRIKVRPEHATRGLPLYLPGHSTKAHGYVRRGTAIVDPMLKKQRPGKRSA